MEAQFILDVTMANNEAVSRITYALRSNTASMAIEGFIWFQGAKELTMVEELLPQFNVRISTMYENEALYDFLKHHSIYIKFWFIDDDTWEMTLETLWHHVNPVTNQHLWNGV